MAGNDKEFEPTRSRRSVNAGSEGRRRAKKRRGVGVFSGRRRAAGQSASGVSEQRPDNRRNPFVHAKNKDHPLGWSLALAYVPERISIARQGYFVSPTLTVPAFVDLV